MTKKLALDYINKEVINLALPCFNAIKTIAGKRECPKCWGKGHLNRRIAIKDCNVCNGTGKVGYVWEPVLGDKVVIGEYMGVLVETDHMEDSPYRCWDGHIEKTFNKWDIEESIAIPILDWEEIEKILMEMDYSLDLHGRFNCQIHPPGKINAWSKGGVLGKSRQEAVMKAVIALKKGVRNDGVNNALTQGG